MGRRPTRRKHDARSPEVAVSGGAGVALAVLLALACAGEGRALAQGQRDPQDGANGNPASVAAAPLPPAPAPPPFNYTPAPEPVRAPFYALWAGGRLGISTYGGSFYEYQVTGQASELETAGRLVGAGPSAELDVGVRLGKRFVPYVLYERTYFTRGSRFEGTDTSLVGEYYGLGFRTVFGNVDRVGVVADVALGFRSLSASSSSGNWRMHTFELFRFGIGAEVRISNSFTLSPMLTLATSAMQTADGSVRFKSGSGDISAPVYQEGASIDAARTYIIVGLGCGAHFDFFAHSK